MAPDHGPQPEGAKAKPLTVEEFAARLRRNMEAARAREAAQRATGADVAPASASASAPALRAVTPEQATPETPWPPKGVRAQQQLDKSLLTPQPAPHKRKPRYDEPQQLRETTRPAPNVSG